jgi:hypothetical protein
VVVRSRHTVTWPSPTQSAVQRSAAHIPHCCSRSIGRSQLPSTNVIRAICPPARLGGVHVEKLCREQDMMIIITTTAVRRTSEARLWRVNQATMRAVGERRDRSVS